MSEPKITPGIRYPERVVVIGTSGSGKSTFARELASRLSAKHVELDSIRHQPNWTEDPPDVFRQKVESALSGDRWVVDGNYSEARGVVWPRATTIVWLDFWFGIVLWRLFWRTLRRGILRTELWNGNRENLWENFFSRESLFLWAMNTHWSRRKSLPTIFELPEHVHLDVIRLRSPRKAARWLNALDDLS